MVDCSRIRVWSPGHDQLSAGLENAVATALSSAFSSRDWQCSPMPIGNASDPHSALGIMSQLGDGLLLIATPDVKAGPVSEVLGCVLGGVLCEPLIEGYGLGKFGARSGDAILAYIGVAPLAQGTRGILRNDGHPGEVVLDAGYQGGSEMAVSLASVLFSEWLELPGVSSCPTVYVRTRETIGAILHLLERHDFEYQGQFELEFRGTPQARLVYRRRNMF